MLNLVRPRIAYTPVRFVPTMPNGYLARQRRVEKGRRRDAARVVVYSRMEDVLINPEAGRPNVGRLSFGLG